MNKMTRMLSFLFVFCFIICSGCGNATMTDAERAELALDNGYDDFISEEYSTALEHADSSIGYTPTENAYIFKSQVQYKMDDKTGADDTLVEFDSLYPDDGKDDLINAVYLSLDSGDCDQIRTHLQTAFGDDYAGIECEPYWVLVEEDDDFSYFRDSCSTQYETLEEIKTDCPDGLVAGSCRENVTKFEKKVIGPKLWISNSDTRLVDDAAFIVNTILRFAPLPPVVKQALSLAITARSAEIKARNNGCGVVLHWLWINFPSITFWVTAQK